MFNTNPHGFRCFKCSNELTNGEVYHVLCNLCRFEADRLPSKATRRAQTLSSALAAPYGGAGITQPLGERTAPFAAYLGAMWFDSQRITSHEVSLYQPITREQELSFIGFSLAQSFG